MSDTFDHEGDAWDNFASRGDEDMSSEYSIFGAGVNNSADYFIETSSMYSNEDPTENRASRTSKYCKTTHNRPLAVPTIWVDYAKIVTQTSKAYMLLIEVHGYPADVWLPKALCWDMSKDRVLLPEAFWLNKLEEI